MQQIVDTLNIKSTVAGCCGDVPKLRFGKEEVNGLVSSLKALAHPVRLQIVDLLNRHGGEVCVCDIEEQFEQKQPTISHHLRILREAGLIDCERRGLWAYYYPRPENLGPVRDLVAGWSE